MTRTEILQTALRRVGLTETSSSYIDQARVYANQVKDEIASRAEWWFLFKEATLNAVAGTKTYALESDLLHPLSFRNVTRSWVLPITSYHDLDLDDPDQSYSGTPEWVIPLGVNSSGVLQVDLHPTPADADEIKYRYYAFLPEWVSGSDATDVGETIPVILQPAIYFGVARLFKQEKGDDEGATSEYREMERTVNYALRVNGQMFGNREVRLKRRDSRVGYSMRVNEGSLS